MASSWTTAYDDGYKAGRADKLLGRSSQIARTAPNADYGLGYSDGQLGKAMRPPRPPVHEAVPTQKSPEIDAFLSKLTGRDRRLAVAADKCATCGGDAAKFKDEKSRKEFTISGMCQQCQDKVFEGPMGDARKVIREELYLFCLTALGRTA